MVKKAKLDENGQPHPGYCMQYRSDRAIDELAGICKAVVADGHVSQEESKFILDWVQLNRDFRDVWPISILVERLLEMLSDDWVIDADERQDLLETLRQIAGKATEDVQSSTVLPLDSPPPSIEFQERSFCVTGTFEYGPRASVVRMIIGCGGIADPNVKRSTNYLVIGKLASRDWKHSAFGRKIEAALKKKESHPIAIVAEEHFLQEVARTQA